MGFSRQEYWTGLPFPSPEDLPDPGIKPGSPALQEDSLLFKLPGKYTAERANFKSSEPGVGKLVMMTSLDHGFLSTD